MPDTSLIAESEKVEDSTEIQALRSKVLELQTKLQVEEKMFEASRKMIEGFSRQSNIQQVQNSLDESKTRINFLKDQIGETEKQLQCFELDRSESGKTLYHDIIDSNSKSPKGSFNEIDFWTFGGRLNWAKIDYKIEELSCRLRVAERFLEGQEKVAEALKENAEKLGKDVDSDDLKKIKAQREMLKQRIMILGQALKKYTSLSICTSAMPSSKLIPQPSDASRYSVTHSCEDNQFAGEMLIKITKISGLPAPSEPPFTFSFELDQLTNFRSGNHRAVKDVHMTVGGPEISSKQTDSSEFPCYQETKVKLNRASELEIIVRSGSSQAIKGLFFSKLAAILVNGPNEKSSFTGVIEVEPAGSLEISLHYEPDYDRKNQIERSKQARIERRPVIKRTQHFVQGHELISVNFFQLLKCSYCQDLIMNTGGYQCKLCKLVCHKKCHAKVFNKCLNWNGEADGANQSVILQNPEVLEFILKFKIPHRQKLVSVGIPTWCAHCGHILPFGRKVNYKCEECSLFWHDRCDPHICKSHCGLNAKILESFDESLRLLDAKRSELVSSLSPVKNQAKSASLASIGSLLRAASLSGSHLDLEKYVTIDDFKLIRCIGKGNFGKVMLAKIEAREDSSTKPSYYAIKMLKKHGIVDNEEYSSLLTEKRIFMVASEAQFPFLVQLRHLFQDDQRIYFVMEYINGGDLMFHIQRRPFSVDDCRFYAAQVVLALEFLHQNEILYRDLKLDNILLTNKGYIKLADYGLSKCDMKLEGTTRTFCGTPEFMAPEILLDVPYGFSVDYWAFGVLLYQMLESRSPFYGASEKEIFQSILKSKPTFSPALDKDGKSLITKLLLSNPAQRIGIKDGHGWKAVKEHEFFSKIDWEALKKQSVAAPFVPGKTVGPEDISNFDEMFTNEDVMLTPYPSFVFSSQCGVNAQKATAIFAEFSIN